MKYTLRLLLLTMIISIGCLFPVYADTEAPNGADNTNIGTIQIDSETAENASSVPGNVSDEVTQDTDSFESAFDLRTLSYISPVENQGMTNSCWAFAALTSAESSAMSSGLGLGIDYSELYAVFFANQLHDSEGLVVTDSEGSTDPFDVLLDNGEYIASRMISWAGPVEESRITDVFPAYGSHEIASLSGLTEDDASFASDIRIQNIDYLPSPASRDSNLNYTGYNADGTNAIKQAVHGGTAVMVCLNANRDYFNLKNKASYVSEDTTLLNHAVAIVGWDDSYSKNNFRDTPEGDGAWICKNSWGTQADLLEDFKTYVHDNRSEIEKAYREENPDESESAVQALSDEELAKWYMRIDEDGYFYVSYYDKSLYNPMVFHTELNEYTKNYQYDQLNMLSVTTPAQSEASGTEANVFTAGEDQEIQAVSVYTAEPGSSVNIRIYALDDDAENPEDGKLLSETDAEIQWAGYHTVSLKQAAEVASGAKFSAVVKITNSSGQGYTPLELGYTETWEGSTYAYHVAENTPGQSYILTGDSWTDASEYSISGYTVGSPLIKVFASAKAGAASDGEDSASGTDNTDNSANGADGTSASNTSGNTSDGNTGDNNTAPGASGSTGTTENTASGSGSATGSNTGSGTTASTAKNSTESASTSSEGADGTAASTANGTDGAAKTITNNSVAKTSVASVTGDAANTPETGANAAGNTGSKESANASGGENADASNGNDADETDEEEAPVESDDLTEDEEYVLEVANPSESEDDMEIEDAPETGDSMTWIVWGGVFAAAVILLVVILCVRKKNRSGMR